MKLRYAILYLIIGINTSAFAQDNFVDLIIILENKNGGYFHNKTVKITSKSSGKTYTTTSDTKGTAQFSLPNNAIYNLKISNYAKEREIRVPNIKGGTITNVYTYSPNMLEMDKKFAMSTKERQKLDNFKTTLPDTLFLKSSRMKTPIKNKTYYASVKINLKNIKNGPLANEVTTITGEKSKKSIKTITNKNGSIHVYVPKGDTYTLNFTYNNKYAKFESKYSKGTSHIKLGYSYLGTAEIERRKEIEALRIAAEEKRLKEEEARFKTKCESLKLTLEECKKVELKEYIDALEMNNENNVISKVFNRNNWENKLVVCDLTGSMSPYTAELSIWYTLNIIKEKNIQFTFFNDGDALEDNEKTIGATGGIYYSNATDTNKLNNLVAKVSAAGNGGDCEENDMEAILTASKMAEPFTSLILIADSDSPVRDIELLKDFKHPIHIILCGFEGFILTDYLKMAWKTKGSIHTIEEDIISIANMLEGQTITIQGNTYKIMGGEFIQIN
ncbi:MAG: hypothetical protein ACPG6B_07825 [Oceanihabitans sp.]